MEIHNGNGKREYYKHINKTQIFSIDTIIYKLYKELYNRQKGEKNEKKGEL